MSKVFIIGGGAAGMAAAIAAAENYNEVHIFEKNEKLGKKLFITGKGRCNLTNASDINNHFQNIVRNNKFLHSAYHNFMYEDIMKIVEDEGIPLKIERGNRVFPVSDKSSDIIKALVSRLEKNGVVIHLNSNIKSIKKTGNNTFELSCIYKGQEKHLSCDYVIVATGGISYKSTGSTGDGYDFAKHFGHKITKLYPSLVPLKSQDVICKQLQGLSLKNVGLSLYVDGKKMYEDMGEMLFTHFGISGPLVLSASSYLTEILDNNAVAHIDLKPSLSFEQLDKRILRDFEKNINKIYKHSLDDLLPKKMIPVIIQLSNIDERKKVNEITKEERHTLIKLIKEFKLNICSTMGLNEAIITRGGIDVTQINPKNMESKLMPGLYFAGEVIDVDAMTGGYNLQIAWSTGFLAGGSIW